MKELKDNNVENALLNPVKIDPNITNGTNGSLRDNDILVVNMNKFNSKASNETITKFSKRNE